MSLGRGHEPHAAMAVLVVVPQHEAMDPVSGRSQALDHAGRLPIGKVDVLAEKVVEAVRKKRPQVIYPHGYAVTG